MTCGTHGWRSITRRAPRIRARSDCAHDDIRRLGAEAAHLGLDLGEGALDEPVEDRVLVGQVVVDRHRLDAEVVRETAHREGVDAVAIGDRGRGLEHPVLRERRALGEPASRHPSTSVFTVARDIRPGSGRAADAAVPYSVILTT